MTSTHNGSKAVVTYDEKICSHAGECVKGMPQVFDPSKTPWIQPGDHSFESIEQVVKRCPSGALKVTRA